ncbi:orotidine-5'-phosphate decarboxylase [Candidatus Magnetomorum sp. HK-1]|nr:orotidine-5'-phosphate decarboxylase [Candidatus Magnetomorum sp. HK-1]
MKTPQQKICIALDVDDANRALELIDQLKSHVGLFKVGMQLFYRYGPELVQEMVSRGAKIFLDLKFHDIPNTVKNASIAAVRMKVAIFNVHAGGGLSMMQQAVAGAKEAAQKEGFPLPQIIGVTILTSLTQEMLSNELNLPGTLESRVVKLAKLSKTAGLDGVVASPHELELIQSTCGSDFTIITPGIRPLWAVSNDQKRIMTPKAAIEKGANYIVVGRPIIQADDPALAVCRLFENSL